MSELFARVFGPQLDAIESSIRQAARILEQFFKGDKDLRKTQSENEPLADGFQQGSNVAGVDTMTISPQSQVQLQAPFTTFLDGQIGSDKRYSYIVVVIESTSGAGRYTLQSGINPDTTSRGMEIPAGGTTLEIPGYKNIQNFKMCPTGGGTLNYTIQGFI
jgi:hypothetical protein